MNPWHGAALCVASYVVMVLLVLATHQNIWIAAWFIAQLLIMGRTRRGWS